MATYKSDNEYTGGMGNLVFYTLNGKKVVRAKRSKMTPAEKKKLNPAIKRQNSRLGSVSKFCKVLREGIPEKFAGDLNRHSALVSRVSREILNRDSISDRDEFKIRKEHLHHLNGVILNGEFPAEILDRLNATKFVVNGENLEVEIPALPLSALEKQPQGFKLWVQIKIVSLDHPYAVSYIRMKESKPIETIQNEGMTFSFDLPEVDANESFFAAVGFKSLLGGKMVEDLRLNGYVVVSF